MSKKALITGVTGQDGSYLAEFLLEKGYEVHGMVRRSSTEKRERIDHLESNPNFHVHYGDLSDSMSIMRLVGMIKPDEIYNLAAQSHVGVSFDVPEYTVNEKNGELIIETDKARLVYTGALANEFGLKIYELTG